MSVAILTKDDLLEFKLELLQEITQLFTKSNPNLVASKKWIKSNEVRKLLKISPGTLQNLRVNGTLKFTKIGGIMFYDQPHIMKMLEENVEN